MTGRQPSIHDAICNLFSQWKSVMLYKGYEFVVRTTNKTTGTVYYSCKYFRHGCRARAIKKNGNLRAVDSHCCDRELPSRMIDVRREMRCRLVQVALDNLSEGPSRVWERVLSEMSQLHGGAPIDTIPKAKSVNIVKNSRSLAFGGDALRALSTSDARFVSDSDKRVFIPFNATVPGAGDKERKVVGFGHPDLIRLLRYPGCALFIDGTFKMVPKPYVQCLIIMVMDPSVDVYIPALYVLMTGKTEDAYLDALHFVLVASDRRLDPATVTCDFELALIKAVLAQFPKATIVGCLFHWKQALRRKMLEYGIDNSQVRVAMETGKIDVLTVIPVEEIADKGIRYVRSVVDESGSKEKWDKFWRYFERVWMTRYDASLWNVRGMVDAGVDIANRTNNPLEKYNRDFGEQFKQSHPSLFVFLDVTKAEAARYLM